MTLLMRMTRSTMRQSIKSWLQVYSHVKSVIFLRLSAGLSLITTAVLSGSRMKIQNLENWLLFTHGGTALSKTVFLRKILMLT
ncbi:Uncharacterised protein [Klebsiella pneumoniae]|nr:Uncharacterised protein [Klebsiella pneumoniae]